MDDALPRFDLSDAPGAPPRLARRSLALGAHLLRGTGAVIDCTIDNLSASGCGVKCAEYLWKDERLTLSIPGRGTIGVDVRWCSDGQAGLRFDSPPPTPGRVPVERVTERYLAEAEVTLRRLGISAYRVTIRDVAQTGCKVELVDRPAVNERVMIKFDGLEPLEGRVQWVDGFVAGIAFDRLIHPLVFDMLEARLNG